MNTATPALRLAILPLLASVFFIPGTTAQPAGRPPVEFVESFPVETVLGDPEIPETREVWLAMITAARHTLDIEQFYIANRAGEALDTVIAAILDAAERSVRVRCIVDARMYRTYPETADRLSRQAGIQVRVIDYGVIAGGVQHAKFFVVDGETVFLGSQNFDWRALSHIRELGLRIRDPRTARFFQSVFETDWTLAGAGGSPPAGDSAVRRAAGGPFVLLRPGGDSIRITPTGSPRALIPDTSAWDEEHLVRLIDGAREGVLLQFLSYERMSRNAGDYAVLDEAIRRAAARGVKVRMIVSDWEKAAPGERDLTALASLPNVEVCFSAIPEWSGGYIPYARVEHCKFVVVDAERFWLGTSNAGKGYFHTSRNVGVVVESRVLAERLQRFFQRGWEGPYAERVTPGRTYLRREHGGEEP